MHFYNKMFNQEQNNNVPVVLDVISPHYNLQGSSPPQSPNSQQYGSKGKRKSDAKFPIFIRTCVRNPSTWFV